MRHLLIFRRQHQMLVQRAVGAVFQLGQHMADEGGGAPLQQQYQCQLPYHSAPAEGEDHAQQEKQQRQRVRHSGGVDAVEGEVKAQKTDQRHDQRHRAAQHTNSTQSKTDVLTDHALSPPLAFCQTD